MKTLETRVLCALLVGVVLGGCAGTPPETHEYLLQPQPSERASGDRSAVVLNSVVLAPYLDQQGIVLQTSAAEIHVARHHQWAEPLADAVGRYLQVAVGNLADVQVEMGSLTTGDASRKVTVRINRLHGDAQGEVRLVADWLIETDGAEPVLSSFDERARQSANGYGPLVATHEVVLDRFARAIADSLR